MKLNWTERWVVNNPIRVLQQQFEMRWFKKVVSPVAGGIFLEVGCGRGAGARLIHRAFQPSELHCMDIDIQMITHAQKYLSPEERGKTWLYTADLTHLPYKSNTVDAVFDFGAVHHVPDWRGALGEISRVIKPGGIFYLEELYPSLYQNFITKRILLHPTKDRFLSHDLRNAMKKSNLKLRYVLEYRGFGILGVAFKEF